MNFAQLVTTYIAANILATLGFLMIGAITLGFRISTKHMGHHVELKLHYLTLGVILLLTMAHPFFPKREIFTPMVKVWAAQSGNIFEREYVGNQSAGYLAAPSIQKMVPLNTASFTFFGIVATLILAGGLRLVLDLRRLSRIRARSFLIRKINSLHIYVSPEVQVPFSFWLPGEQNIVIPDDLLGKPSYRIAVLHEIHHHRNGDTRWVYLLWGLRLIFFVNPIIHLWNRWICEVQEFACDEALVASRKVESLAYARCLVQVAQNVVGHERYPACATGLSFVVDRNTLKRRIKKMLAKKQMAIGWKAGLPALAMIIGILSVTAYSAQGFVQDRRVTLIQAQEMAKAAQGTDGFPVVVNDKVLKWLNYYLGTPEGRDRVKDALVRLENYRSIIGKKLDQYKMPSELLAIPLIESGYQNLGPSRNPVKAAGLWQFIASTATNFGLRVDQSVDERLDAEIESDAAMRLLLANKLRFNDWQLSILAYNSGEKAVQEAIARTGSRDAWALIRSDFGSEENVEYLPKLMAGILVMKNPSVL